MFLGSVLALALALVVAFSLLAHASFVHAASTNFQEVLETMMSTQTVDALFHCSHLCAAERNNAEL